MNAIFVLAVLVSAYSVIGAVGGKAAVKPDLVILSINAPSTFSNGVPTMVNVTTKNQGDKFAGASTTRLNAYGLQYSAVPSLAAGATYISSFIVTCNNGGNNSSIFTLYGNADIYNNVLESNEGNNQLSIQRSCV
ncbi:MAG: hypothetical protein NTV88_04000 [Candidatus Micrarchaeota archaeon]|nr:hypothetical protein [Candidatus Micrarchaeota archaeon]